MLRVSVCVVADDVVDHFLADVSVAVCDCNAVKGPMDATVPLQTDADNHHDTREGAIDRIQSSSSVSRAREDRQSDDSCLPLIVLRSETVRPAGRTMASMREIESAQRSDGAMAISRRTNRNITLM